MSSQKHGKQIEDMLKALVYSGSADSGRSPTMSGFDIEADFDSVLGIPTSIKATKKGSPICLADARAWWKIDTPIRILVASWTQVDITTKEFYAIHEFIIHGKMLEDMRGCITYEDVKEFHNGLSLDIFPYGEHNSARLWAKKQIKNLGKSSLVTLNPKIDSYKQRRLQCTVTIAKITDFVLKYPSLDDNYPNYNLYLESIGSLLLPQRIRSSPRK